MYLFQNRENAIISSVRHAGRISNSDWTRSDHLFLTGVYHRNLCISNRRAKLRAFVHKMILQEYTSWWIDPNYVLVFTVCLGMAQIFADFLTGSKQIAPVFCHFCLICLLPVGKSANIWAIPRHTVKTKT